ncbi:MAG TPA: pitrilysin family protein [Candidatus Didemnitutus sp.]|nr:pitrilysin family protein [Candidatus Didemnitutus sp.]
MKRIFFLFSVLCLLSSGLRAQIAAHVVRTKIAGIDVLVYKTGVKDVVTIKGSFPGGDSFAGQGNVAVPTLCGMLLDQGTTKHDKFAIADQLEGVGATIEFHVDTHLVEVEAKCLKKDMPLVVGLLAEQLRTPALSADEFEKAKTQYAGSIKRSLENTDYRAGEAFTRAVYPAGHPNRPPSPEEMLAAIDQAKLEDVKAFHAKYYGPAHFTLVAVGDVDAAALQGEVAKSFAGWSGGVAMPATGKVGPTDAAKTQDVFMADKTSVSVLFGQASGLRYSDPDYVALRTATSILGSDFTSRLVAIVRDTEGLTYGIRANLNNDTFGEGDWRISATFAPELLNKGIDSTTKQLKSWYEQGVTTDELAKRKTNLVGRFKVGLATTDGMADSLLLSVDRGVGPEWLDQYPGKVNSLDLAHVNSAIKKYLNPDEMLVIKAGTIPGAK